MNVIRRMRLVWLLLGFSVCVELNANVAASSKTAIDTQAPGYYARAIGRAAYAKVPVFDSEHRSLREPVFVRDRAQLDQLASIFEHAVFEPAEHFLMVLAGGPITFYAADNHPVLTWEPIGTTMRLNSQDYRIDKKSAAAIHDWLEKAQETENLRHDKAQEPSH